MKLTDELGGLTTSSATLEAKPNSRGINIKSEDFDMLKEKVPAIIGIDINQSLNYRVETVKGTFEKTMNGSTEDIVLTGKNLLEGRYYTKSDIESANHVCVIDADTAIDFFGTTDVLGLSMELTANNKTQDFIIIGIKESPQGMLTSLAKTSLDVPYTVLKTAFGVEEKIDKVNLYIDNQEDKQKVLDFAVMTLRIKYNLLQDENEIITGAVMATDQIDNMTKYVTLFVAFVAGISLVVGGIGVMNIMLVSVTERTREISIRKALGARTIEIKMQFLCESAIITFTGGTIGILIGAGIATLVSNIAHLKQGLDLKAVLVATLFSVSVGLFFGVYPASKAAKLRPIEALRHQ